MSEEKLYGLSPYSREFLSVGQVAKLLGVHPQTVRRWLRDGLIKNFIQYGHYGHYKIHKSVISLEFPALSLAARPELRSEDTETVTPVQVKKNSPLFKKR